MCWLELLSVIESEIILCDYNLSNCNIRKTFHGFFERGFLLIVYVLNASSKHFGVALDLLDNVQ